MNMNFPRVAIAASSLVVLALAGLGGCSTSSVAEPAGPTPPASEAVAGDPVVDAPVAEPTRPTGFAVVAVADDPEPVKRWLDGVRGSLPAGARVASQSVRSPGGAAVEVPVLEVVTPAGTTHEAHRATLDAWAAEHPLPAGRLGWGPLEQPGADGGGTVQIGHRSYVLAGEPIVSESDVAEAKAQNDAIPPATAMVAIRLTPAAAETFAAATRDATGKRLAIVVDGLVMAAPRVQQQLLGGTMSFAVPGTPAEQEAEVRRLAAQLDPRTRPGAR